MNLLSPLERGSVGQMPHDYARLSAEFSLLPREKSTKARFRVRKRAISPRGITQAYSPGTGLCGFALMRTRLFFLYSLMMLFAKTPNASCRF